MIDMSKLAKSATFGRRVKESEQWDPAYKDWFEHATKEVPESIKGQAATTWENLIQTPETKGAEESMAQTGEKRRDWSRPVGDLNIQTPYRQDPYSTVEEVKRLGNIAQERVAQLPKNRAGYPDLKSVEGYRSLSEMGKTSKDVYMQSLGRETLHPEVPIKRIDLQTVPTEGTQGDMNMIDMSKIQPEQLQAQQVQQVQPPQVGPIGPYGQSQQTMGMEQPPPVGPVGAQFQEAGQAGVNIMVQPGPGVMTGPLPGPQDIGPTAQPVPLPQPQATPSPWMPVTAPVTPGPEAKATIIPGPGIEPNPPPQPQVGPTPNISATAYPQPGLVTPPIPSPAPSIQAGPDVKATAQAQPGQGPVPDVSPVLPEPPPPVPAILPPVQPSPQAGSGAYAPQRTGENFYTSGKFPYPPEWMSSSDVLTQQAYGMPTDIPTPWKTAEGLGNIMTETGRPVSQDPWYQQAKGIAQTDIEDAIKQAAEQAGMGGMRWSTPMGRSAQDIAGRTMARTGLEWTGREMDAMEQARQRQLQGAGLLGNLGQGYAGLSEAAKQRGLTAAQALGPLGQRFFQAPMDWTQQMMGMGGVMQAQQQADLGRQYQEFMRQTPEASPWLGQGMAFSSLNPQQVQQQYTPGGTSQALGALGSMLPLLGLLL